MISLIIPVLLNTLLGGFGLDNCCIACFFSHPAHISQKQAIYNLAASGFFGNHARYRVVIFVGFLDSLVGNVFFLGGTIYVMVFALIVRFYAIPYGGVTSGYSRVPLNLFDASKSLGYSQTSTSIKLTLPLLRTSIIASAILTFVDIVKELPMTLILRPFNFETLATYTYQFAHDELMIEASLPAFFIILTGLIPILLIQNQLNRFLFKKLNKI